MAESKLDKVRRLLVGRKHQHVVNEMIKAGFNLSASLFSKKLSDKYPHYFSGKELDAIISICK